MHSSSKVRNTDRVLQIGQIGHGRWGKNIARTLREDIGDVTVHIASTPTQAKQLLKRPLDAAIIATPGSTHAEIALPFIGQGIPTYIEKPLTTSLRDAQKIAAAAKKSSATIFVGHIHLFSPAYQAAKQLARKAGPIKSMHFEGMNNGPIRDDMSALWDWAPHDVAMALDLLNRTPRSVQAWGQKILRPRTNLYDTALLKLTFPKGVTVTIHNSWLSPEKRKKAIIAGSKDTIVYDDTADKKVTLYRSAGPRVRGTKARERAPRVSHPRYDLASPLEVELRAFLQTVATGKKPITDIEHALAVIKTLAAAERSMSRDGVRISL